MDNTEQIRKELVKQMPTLSETQLSNILELIYTGHIYRVNVINNPYYDFSSRKEADVLKRNRSALKNHSNFKIYTDIYEDATVKVILGRTIVNYIPLELHENEKNRMDIYLINKIHKNFKDAIDKAYTNLGKGMLIMEVNYNLDKIGVLFIFKEKGRYKILVNRLDYSKNLVNIFIHTPETLERDLGRMTIGKVHHKPQNTTVNQVIEYIANKRQANIIQVV